MKSFSTARCAEYGHPEFTIQVEEGSPIPNVQRILLNYFEAAVAQGARFVAGQLVELGWSKVRVCARADGTLGVEERTLTPEVAWTESVTRALHDVWFQKEVVASVGLREKVAFPSQDETIMVSGCADSATDVVLTRLEAGELPAGFSGWTLTCAEEHEHTERDVVPLLAIAAVHPGLVQFLALPRGTTVLVSFRAKPGGPPDELWLKPHVFHGGAELTPEPTSYLAALQRR